MLNTQRNVALKQLCFKLFLLMIFSGVLVFLDVCQADVLDRLHRMKVQRIVGQTDGISMQDILKYRSQFYERCYDVRVMCERNASPEVVAQRVITSLTSLENVMHFRSTRASGCSGLDFNDVIVRGLAPDGGLFVTEAIPTFERGELERLMELIETTRTQANQHRQLAA